jgi:hypothetical protein
MLGFPANATLGYLLHCIAMNASQATEKQLKGKKSGARTLTPNAGI